MNVKTVLEQEDISADGLKMLRIARLHPKLKTRCTAIIIYVNIFLSFFIVILAIKGIIHSYKDDLFFVVECLQSCMLLIHCIIKLIIMHSSRTALLRLIKKRSNFWKVKDFEQTSLWPQCLTIITFAKKIIRFYLYIVIITGVAFHLQTLQTGLLPTVCYVPQGWFNYLMVMMWYLTFVVLFSVQGTDCFFCSLASSLIVQFKLLAYTFKNLTILSTNAEIPSDNKIWNKLQELIDYHNYLLSYCEELNMVFRGIFLFQFVISIASASVSVFIFMEPGPWINRIKFLLYLSAIMFETGFYCVPLEFVTNTAHEINDAVYESAWYRINGNQLKKSLSVVINRAQRPVTFSAYGLINMNLRTYVLICKTAFSYYTYLNTVQKLS